MTITADQLRAARALIKMEQRTLAEAADVPVQTLKRYEGATGPLSGNYQNITALIKVLEANGVIFLDTNDTTNGGPGVRVFAPGLVLPTKRMPGLGGVVVDSGDISE